LPSGWRLVRLSNRLNETRMSWDAVLKCGSNLAMSPAWAVTSSLFWVVWACAAPGNACGTAPTTPSVAAPLSSWRRVISMGRHLRYVDRA